MLYSSLEQNLGRECDPTWVNVIAASLILNIVCNPKQMLSGYKHQLVSRGLSLTIWSRALGGGQRH